MVRGRDRATRALEASDPARARRRRVLPFVVGVATALLVGSVAALAGARLGLPGEPVSVLSLAPKSRGATGSAPSTWTETARAPSTMRFLTYRDGVARPAPATFALASINTGDEIEVALSGPGGEPDEASYRALRHLMRCLRTEAESPIDPRLVDLFRRIAERAQAKIELISGFRAATSRGDRNYHTRGMAADIRVVGMTATALRDLVRALGAPGIGYYPVSHFVHVDVRDKAFAWTDYTGPAPPPGEGSNRHEPTEAPEPEESDDAPVAATEAP
jgi:uncharacterized protein YcbK (DUF882 family)